LVVLVVLVEEEDRASGNLRFLNMAFWLYRWGGKMNK